MTETAPKKNQQRYDTKNETPTLSHPHTLHTCPSHQQHTQIRLKETRPTTTTRLTMKLYCSANASQTSLKKEQESTSFLGERTF